LQWQKTYWKQRYTVRWTKLRDESTKFFHAAATERYRLNTITSLDTEEGRSVSTHQEKAAILWEEYKSRLGTTTETNMVFELQDLITQHNLEEIVTPFTKEDINKVVKELSNDKALDLMASMGLFLKKMLKHNQRGHIQCLL
jgi:hypothetical protein